MCKLEHKSLQAYAALSTHATTRSLSAATSDTVWNTWPRFGSNPSKRTTSFGGDKVPYHFKAASLAAYWSRVPQTNSFGFATSA